MATNRFADCESIEQVIGQAVGAGSACWSTLTYAGEFDSTEAAKVVDEAHHRVMEMIYESYATALRTMQEAFVVVSPPPTDTCQRVERSLREPRSD